ncbi:MAG: molybdopterin-dependent oxidoreductase [Actinomycetota bacterium]|nr:molybdopterin-dependent oxidoreductase [Actinomycetota bacterium]
MHEHGAGEVRPTSVETGSGASRPHSPGRGLGLTARQVNLLLEVLILSAIGTGIVSWAVGTAWSRWWTVAHALCGLGLLVLAPAKMRRSVRTGMRRGRPTRWLSTAFGVLVLATVGLGVLHATGLWFGVGYWAALWTHFLAAFALFPLFMWHVASRPVGRRTVDERRRLLLGGAAVAAAAGVAYAAQETVVRATGLAGGTRRFTGSHEVGSHDPDAMPTVSWIDDEAPDTAVEDWVLDIAGTRADLRELAALARPIEAALDCTGGWWSTQRWDAVPLSELGGLTGARSIRVRSATGYERLLPAADAADLHLAVGYEGRPLRRGHGAPVRLVAPGRRGPWWVKWVVEVAPDDRPWWLQLPFPAT